MREEDYRKIEMEQDGMQLILEFPQNSNDKEYIKSEVKQILSDMLQEHLTKNL